MTSDAHDADAHDADVLDDAVRALLSGAVVGIPTDTVYGLAVDPRQQGAADAVFVLKNRPARLELPVLVADVAQADALSGPHGLPELAGRLVERFWPGPLTVVVPRRAGLDWALGGDGRTVGLRCPAHPVARSLCERVGPLATTSANRHGAPAMTTAAEVVREFGDAVAVVIDGGVCDGTTSTVVVVAGGRVQLVRDGAVPWNDVLEITAPG